MIEPAVSGRRARQTALTRAGNIFLEGERSPGVKGTRNQANELDTKTIQAFSTLFWGRVGREHSDGVILIYISFVFFLHGQHGHFLESIY